jgi:hypothetical protein
LKKSQDVRETSPPIGHARGMTSILVRWAGRLVIRVFTGRKRSTRAGRSDVRVRQRGRSKAACQADSTQCVECVPVDGDVAQAVGVDQSAGGELVPSGRAWTARCESERGRSRSRCAWTEPVATFGLLSVERPVWEGGSFPARADSLPSRRRGRCLDVRARVARPLLRRPQALAARVGEVEHGRSARCPRVTGAPARPQRSPSSMPRPRLPHPPREGEVGCPAGSAEPVTSSGYVDTKDCDGTGSTRMRKAGKESADRRRTVPYRAAPLAERVSAS